MRAGRMSSVRGQVRKESFEVVFGQTERRWHRTVGGLHGRPAQ